MYFIKLIFYPEGLDKLIWNNLSENINWESTDSFPGCKTIIRANSSQFFIFSRPFWSLNFCKRNLNSLKFYVDTVLVIYTCLKKNHDHWKIFSQVPLFQLIMFEENWKKTHFCNLLQFSSLTSAKKELQTFSSFQRSYFSMNSTWYQKN